MNTTEQQSRDKRNGQYAAKLETVCRCGHRCGEHTSVRAAGQQPCLEDGCNCQRFKRRKG